MVDAPLPRRTMVQQHHRHHQIRTPPTVRLEALEETAHGGANSALGSSNPNWESVNL